MAQCLVVNATGQLELSAADPCTTLLALTPAEYGAIAATPWNLSPEDGLIVSFAVIGVWSAAWCWKALVRTLSDHGDQ